jgi:hypothetical protein
LVRLLDLARAGEQSFTALPSINVRTEQVSPSACLEAAVNVLRLYRVRTQLYSQLNSSGDGSSVDCLREGDAKGEVGGKDTDNTMNQLFRQAVLETQATGGDAPTATTMGKGLSPAQAFDQAALMGVKFSKAAKKVRRELDPA